MVIRNSTYTVCNGKQFELTLDRDENYVLYSYGDLCPGINFQRIEGRVGLLKGMASKGQVTNAFSVYTYAKYKSYIFQVDKLENLKLRLSTSDILIYEKLDLHMVDRGWYDIWVPVSEIESIWEERKESGYNLPFPSNIERRKEITLADI